MQFKEEKEKSEKMNYAENIVDKKVGVNKLMDIICIQLNLIKDTAESIENSIKVLQDLNEGNDQG